jgi:2-polyprenyl-3-methyl-5-hydroxy-6-metoxy-1,4-benzoquinol methylase
MRKGWFKIPGVQAGDRTLEQQMEALEHLLDECRSMTVLDLGCAEGLIGREFARAGAQVLGVDALPDHLKVAREQCQGVVNIRFEPLDLNLVRPEERQPQYDIVLALGVLHKLRHPAPGVRWAARSARHLFVFRPKGGVTDGTVRSKHFEDNVCNAHDILREEGFRLERVTHGGPGETVETWRRVQ